MVTVARSANFVCGTVGVDVNQIVVVSMVDMVAASAPGRVKNRRRLKHPRNFVAVCRLREANIFDFGGRFWKASCDAKWAARSSCEERM